MKIKTLLFPFLLIISLNFLIVGFALAQVHVGPGQPYANIGLACSAKAIHAGDTVYIHKGTYPGGMLIDSLPGTSKKWITICNYKSDSVSILGQWTVSVAHFLRMTGLTFNGNDSASWANGSVYHQLFFNYNYVCFDDLSNITVDHCNFVNLLCGPNKYTTLNTAGNVSIKFTGTDTFEVSNCLFQGNAGSEGLSMNGDRHGLVKNNRFDAPVPGSGSGWASHCKGGSSLITFEQNLYINWPAGAMDTGGATGGAYFCPLADASIYEADSITFCSNISVGGQTCLRLASLSNSVIVNNTFFKANEFTVRLLQEDPNVNFMNNTITNNIFTIVSTGLGYNQFYINQTGGLPYTTFVFNNNLFFSYSDPALGMSGIFQDVGTVNPAILNGSLFGNPLFTDTANLNFALTFGSPAIGTGLKVTVPAADYNGNSFNTKTRSVGAIEFAALAGIREYAEAGSIWIYPNPSAGKFTLSWNADERIEAIAVYNSAGRLIERLIPVNGSVRAGENSMLVDLSAESRGIYKAVLQGAYGSVMTRSLVHE